MTEPPKTAAILALAFGQMVIYAAVYYAFPALLPNLLQETGWSAAELASGPTISYLVMAMLTPLTGRLVDRGWGGTMMAILPLFAALALAFIGLVTSYPAYLALWVVIGVAQAGMLYETCFAILTRGLGTAARPAITKVTLVAGFAGTLAFPLGHFLGNALGSAGAFMVFAAMIPLLVVPLNIWGARHLVTKTEGDTVPEPAHASGNPSYPLRSAMRRPPFWLLALLFGALGLNHTVLLTFVLLFFADRGADPFTAALAASCIGPAQVVGRLALMMFETRIGNVKATNIAVAAVLVAGIVLLFAKASIGLIFAFAFLQGAGMGVLSILRPVLIADRLGRDGFGAISGAIAVSPILATALGPTLGAWALGWNGPMAAYATALGLAVLASVTAGLLTKTAARGR